MTPIKRFLQPLALPAYASTALLLLRVVVGVAFVYHGWGKITNPFAWMGEEGNVPGVFQFLAAISEFGGGMALIVGLITPIAMIGLGITMAVATYTHAVVKEDPFVNQTGGGSYEPALVYLCIAILFLVIGAGKFSLDTLLFGSRQPVNTTQ